MSISYQFSFHYGFLIMVFSQPRHRHPGASEKAISTSEKCPPTEILVLLKKAPLLKFECIDSWSPEKVSLILSLPSDSTVWHSTSAPMDII
jgi:hypothetical protein